MPKNVYKRGKKIVQLNMLVHAETISQLYKMSLTMKIHKIILKTNSISGTEGDDKTDKKTSLPTNK